MESELRDLGNLDFFGLLKTDGDRERVMEQKHCTVTQQKTVLMLARIVVGKQLSG